MDAPTRSTIRQFSKAVTASGGCLLIGLTGGCSGNKHTDWFQFGKEKNTQKQPAEAQTSDDRSNTNQDQPVSEAAADPATQPAIHSNTQQPTHSETKTSPTETEQSQTTTVSQSTPDIQEVIQLYRRLHAEMNLAGRSQVIVELLNDERERVRLLGFDLASRDLSSGATLSAKVANTSIILLSDPLPSIRSGAAGLITRLALPDAMTLLTSSLQEETDPTVAIALLRGVERWPSEDAQEAVLRWYESDEAVRTTAGNAAWSLADLDLWDLDRYGETLRNVYRSVEDDQLTHAEMRLISVTGDKDDIDRLIQLASDTNYPHRANAANALVYTSRGVDPLIRLAQREPSFSGSAAESIIRHRLNPNGVRLVASLPWPDDGSRIESIVRMCNQLDNEQLSEAVNLIRTDQSVDDALTIQLLTPLTTGTQNISARSASGVVLLAELELSNQRPDRALEVISLLPASGIDPAATQRASSVAAKAHILLLEFDQAANLNLTPDLWMSTLSLTSDDVTRTRIAEEINRRDLLLTGEQQAVVNQLLSDQSEEETLEPETLEPDSSVEDTDQTEQP